jgi:lysozyme
MVTSEKGLNLIKRFEGLQLKTYICPAGKLTIGYGHTGKDVKKGMAINISEAENLLKNDVAKFEKEVNSLVKVPLKQYEFDALVSFCYNLGATALAQSTLLKKLNASDKQGAGGEFIRWNQSKGLPIQGLTARREAEQALFFNVKQS